MTFLVLSCGALRLITPSMRGLDQAMLPPAVAHCCQGSHDILRTPARHRTGVLCIVHALPLYLTRTQLKCHGQSAEKSLRRES